MNKNLFYQSMAFVLILLSFTACGEFQSNADSISRDIIEENNFTANRSIEDTSIPLSDAMIWTASWQQATKNTIWWESTLFNSFTIPNESINPLLANGANEIRSYIGIDNDGGRHLLLVGVNSNGEDMLNESIGELVYNFTTPKPPFFGGSLPDTHETAESTIEVEGNQITLETAIEWITKWKTTIKDASWWSENEFYAFTIASSNFSNLLAEGAVDIRTYLGVNSDNMVTMIVVGVDENGMDDLDESMGNRVYDLIRPCPNLCNVSSPLYGFTPE